MVGSSSYDPAPTEVKVIQCLKVLCEHQLIYHSLSLLFHWYSDGPEGSLGLLCLIKEKNTIVSPKKVLKTYHQMKPRQLVKSENNQIPTKFP